MSLRLGEDSAALYAVLDSAAKLYYQMNRQGHFDTQSAWVDKMIHCVGRSAFFNTQRMMKEYNARMWDL
jgi:glucan phosphorylase